MRGFVRSGLALALFATLSVCAACVPKIVRLNEAGDHEAVVSEAAKRKRPPKGPAARALAGSLVALGRSDRARSVLTYDFRHGGEVDSLLDLADLELRQGSDGLAAAHYVRAIELETSMVSNRPNATDVCDLFRRRARAFLAVGEAMAADADMRRVFEVCGVPHDPAVVASDADLRSAIEPRAQALVRARRSFDACVDDCDGATPAQRQAELERSLTEARAEGPRALVDLALARGVSLEPAEVVGLLAAELKGRLRETEILSDSELASLVGYAPGARLQGALGSMRGAESAYATLRLVPFLGLLSEQERTAKRDEAALAGLTILSRTNEDALSWRFAAAVGDASGMDLAITTHLRSVARPEGGADDPGAGPTISGVLRPDGLAGRVFVDRTNLPLLLVYARLRGVRNPRLGLEIERYVLAEARVAEIGGIQRLGREAVARRLAQGQPWHALALAGVVDVPAVVLGQIGTVLADATVLCRGSEDGCEALGSERDLAELVAGPLTAPASGRIAAAPPSDRCPGLHQLMESTSLGSAVSMAAADLGARETGRALGTAVEADLTLACVGHVVAPLLEAGAHDLVARTLADRFGLVPDPRAAQTELSLFRLALAGDRPEQAEVRLRNAAGLAPVPERIWMAAAGRDATRELRMEALRELLLLRPGHEDAADWHRQLVVIRLQDANDDSNTRRYDHAQAALTSLVDDYLDRQPAAARPQLRHELITELAGLTWADDQARAIVAKAVQGPMPQRHEAILAELLGAAPPAGGDPAVVAQALRPEPPATARGVAYRLLDARSATEVAHLLRPMLPAGQEARLEILVDWIAHARLPFLDAEPELAVRLAFDLPLPTFQVHGWPAP